ncbi:MAG: TonB-dependent receptor [Bacteroidota bacterium]|nr:TonB-dependent receptor [Bacteroidota bacterium]
MKRLIFQFLSLLPLFVCAQLPATAIHIESKVDSVPFIDFVKKIERDHVVKFYFDPTRLDSVRVRQSAKSVSIGQILDDSFKGQPLNYFVDGPNIIITRNYKIVSSLPPNFFYFSQTAKTAIPEDNNETYAFLKSPVEPVADSKSKVITIGKPTQSTKGKNCIVSGVVKGAEDGIPIIGATVYSGTTGKATATDASGYFILSLPKGNQELQFKYMGREDLSVPIFIYSDGAMTVKMKEKAVFINEVVIRSEKENILKNLNIGVQQLNIDEVKQLPTILGEADIVKTALLLPGVQTVGEGASGFNVRGGSADQNLMLFDEMPIFNTSHLFGFFSVFNPETVKDFKLYKSGIPANFGGRVSSVFDVTAQTGNLKKCVLSGGISPVTGKLTLEGPLIKDKLSFIIGGRSTYSDWILKKIDGEKFRHTKAGFYDLSGKVTYEIDRNNSLSITAYQSDDNFKLNSDTAYHYQNQCARLYFKHFFNPKTYSQISAIYSNYQYNITSDEVPEISFRLKYNIEYKSVKANVFYIPNTKHSFNSGAEAIRYDMTPGNFTPLSPLSDIKELCLPKERGVETGLFLNDEYTVNSKFTVSAGVRYALFFVLGPYKKYDYNPAVPRSVDSRMDSTLYSSNQIVKTYGGPEVRLSARYSLGANNSLKLSYSRMHQFIHMLTNSSAISPTDVWKISDAQIKPLIGDQLAVGYYHNFLGGELETSIEAYYKKTRNSLDYKSGAELLLNPNLEVDLLSGVGRAYGVELLLQKKRGRLNGWVSYTYSRTELKVDGKFSEEKINNGNYYPADYDKPHNLNLAVNYRYSRRLNLSNTFCYSTGRPITYPVAKYTFRERQLIYYTNRNEYRIPNYLRWDISATIYESLNSKKLAHGSFSIGVYNLLGANNVYSVFFKSTSRGVKGYQMSVFAQPIPNITYNFKF